MAVCHLESCFFIYLQNILTIMRTSSFDRALNNYICDFLWLHLYSSLCGPKNFVYSIKFTFLRIFKFWQTSPKKSFAILFLCFAVNFEYHIINNHCIKKLMFIEYRWNRSISIPWLFWPWIELLYMYKDLVKKTFTELQGLLLWMFESKLCFCCYKDCFLMVWFFLLQFTAPEQSGYVGFANLPNQVHRKSVKKGFEFTLMVVGK